MNKLKKPKLQSPYEGLPLSSTFKAKKKSKKKPKRVDKIGSLIRRYMKSENT